MAENKTIKQENQSNEFKEIESLDKQQLIDIVIRQDKMLRDADAVIKKLSIDNIFTRLDFLFRVLDHNDDFDNDFLNQCRKEIVQLMTIKQKANEATN